MSEQAKHLYQIFSTLTEMLVDRNYLVSREEIDMTLEDFVSKFGENPK